MSFTKFLKRIIESEGSFQGDYNDRGNWTSGEIGVGELKGTKFGISAMSYPTLDIPNLTFEEAKDIYYYDFWKPLTLHKMPIQLQYQILDAAINHGIRKAIKILQYALKVRADGIIGPQTLGALNKVESNDIVFHFLAERLVYIADLQKWDLYGRGWTRRVARCLKYAATDN